MFHHPHHRRGRYHRQYTASLKHALGLSTTVEGLNIEMTNKSNVTLAISVERASPSSPLTGNSASNPNSTSLRQNFISSSPRSDVASPCPTNEPRKYTSPYISDRKNSRRMESVENDISAELPLIRPKVTDRNRVRLSISSLSSSSSTVFSKNLTKSTSSFNIKAADTV